MIGKLISNGFGFVEYSTREDALNAFNTLQNQILDSHNVRIQLVQPKAKLTQSKRRTSAPVNTDSSNTKLHIKNVPFETSKKELKSLCSAAGQMKKLRLPLKSNGSHRGFAFAEYLTNDEAKNALEVLNHTHLYGRHLVVEWAKQDETIQEIKQRTRKNYQKTQT